jgi:DNA repair exonuclease SbcCD ATPase subunit
MATMSRNDDDIKTQVALLEKDMSQVTAFLEKLDSAIEKITDVSASIKELLAVHDHKLSEQKQVNDEIFDLINELRHENHKEHYETKQEISKLVSRVEDLEQLKYKIIGAGFVIGILVSFISNHIPKFT